MGKQVMVSDEAYEYLVQLKLDSKNKVSMKDLLSRAILNNVKGD